MPLTDTTIRNAKPKSKQYKITDEKGMYLLIKPNGSKYFRLDYRIHGKRKTYAIGVYPAITLKKARQIRDTVKKQIADGIDPMQKKKADSNNFQDIALRWFKEKQPTISEATYKRRLRRFENYVFPKIGHYGVRNIKSPDIYAVIKPLIDKSALESAGRLRAEISVIFDYAIAHGFTDYDPSQSVARQIPSKTVQHRAALVNPDDVQKLLRDIDNYQGAYQVQQALKIMPYLFQRPGEVRQMKWKDIFLETAEWRYLVTKTNVQHIVPLSSQVIELLQALKKPFSGSSDYVFPSVKTGEKPISDGTINKALRTMGYDGNAMTAHGFRTVASTFLNEMGWSPDAIERQLCHMPRDQIRSAYNRAQYLDERKKMMQSWADYLDGLKQGADVIPFKQALNK